MRITIACLLSSLCVGVHAQTGAVPATPMDEAARILLEHKIGGLPVVDRERLVGIITITDILRAFVELTASSPKRVARIY